MKLARRSLHTTFASAIGLSALPLLPVNAQPAASKPRKILTISGKIRNFNNGQVAEFDRQSIESLEQSSFRTKTPWYDAPVTFEGVPMAKLMDHVGAFGDRVLAIALNDYTTEIPIADFTKFGVLLAIKRDGSYMPV